MGLIQCHICENPFEAAGYAQCPFCGAYIYNYTQEYVQIPKSSADYYRPSHFVAPMSGKALLTNRRIIWFNLTGDVTAGQVAGGLLFGWGLGSYVGREVARSAANTNEVFSIPLESITKVDTQMRGIRNLLVVECGIYRYEFYKIANPDYWCKWIQHNIGYYHQYGNFPPGPPQ